MASSPQYCVCAYQFGNFGGGADRYIAVLHSFNKAVMEHGTADLIEAVEHGDIPVSAAAKIAKLIGTYTVLGTWRQIEAMIL